MNEIDRAYRRTQRGDRDGFADWVRLVEMPLRKCLRPFARVVDAEAIVQEGLFRMWELAPGMELEGESASLRFALRVVRNLAINEARRMGMFVAPSTDDPPPDRTVLPAPAPDFGLRKVIAGCLARLPAMPSRAILARLRNPECLPDRDLARRVEMTLNTFLQNIVRARKFLRECIESHGIRLQEHLK